MIILLATLFVWAVIGAGLHLRQHQLYKKYPHRYSRRHEGMIAFSDEQTWWMMTLWPLTIVAVILYGIFILLCALVEAIKGE